MFLNALKFNKKLECAEHNDSVCLLTHACTSFDIVHEIRIAKNEGGTWSSTHYIVMNACEQTSPLFLQ